MNNSSHATKLSLISQAFKTPYPVPISHKRIFKMHGIFNMMGFFFPTSVWLPLCNSAKVK